MLPVLRTQMNEQKYELLVILICPHDRWAGPPRNQGATAPTPRSKTCQTGGEWLRNEVFAPDTGFPSCTSAPQPARGPPTRTTPTTNNRRKARQHQVRGINGIMEKLTIRTPPDVLSFMGHTLGFWPQERFCFLPRCPIFGVSSTLPQRVPVISGDCLSRN